MKSKQPRKETPPEASPAAKSDPKAALPKANRSVDMPLAAVFMTQLVLLIYAAHENRHLLNTDAIAYLRIAEYWAQRKMDLMISGYWGPLLSWVIAPFLQLGLEPLNAARVAMVISGVVFLTGVVMLMRRLELSRPSQYVAAWLTAFTSVWWSVDNIAPDLLVAGLMCFGLAFLVSVNWVERRLNHVMAGVCWGLAYLAKPVAFPLAILIIIGLAALHWFCRTAEPKRVYRAAVVSLCCFAAVAGPWVLALSVKYKTFTFSTSGRINHAIVGPTAEEKYKHPFAQHFHVPEKGRVTTWEDPSRMEYPWWSPLASGKNFSYQIDLIKDNATTILAIVMKFDYFMLGLLALLGTLFTTRPSRDALKQERWRWLLWPALCIGGIYLPVYVRIADDRYFYPLFVIALIAGLQLAEWAGAKFGSNGKMVRGIGMAAVVASFGFLAVLRVAVACERIPNPAADTAAQLAARLKEVHLVGPIAGSGMVGYQRAGLYTAFFLEQPWLGDEAQATPQSIRQSGARLYIINRDEALAAVLSRTEGFRDLDRELADSSNPATQSPLQVFEISQR